MATATPAPRYASKATPKLTQTALKTFLKMGEKGETLEQQYTVTPEIARFILEKLNPANRTINAAHVASLIRDINNKNWVASNGSMVSFDREGNLIDGQHRLTALAASSQPLRLSFKFGMPTESKKVIDTGRKRTYGDLLSMEEGKSAKYKFERSSVVRLIYGYMHDQNRPHGYTINNKPTQSDLAAVHETFRETLDDSVKAACSGSHVWRIVIPSYVAFVHFLAKQTKHADKADEFLDLLAHGANMDKDHPIMVVRNRLMNRDEFRSQKNKDRTLGLLVKAFNHFVKGDKVSNKMHTPEHMVRMDGLTKLGDVAIYEDDDEAEAA
jgi:hypothetical protein